MEIVDMAIWTFWIVRQQIVFFRFSSNFNSKNQLMSWRFHFVSQNIFNQENAGLDPDSIYFYEQATDYFVLDNFGNQIVEDDGSFKMIEYDGYLDRSRYRTVSRRR